MSLRISYQWKRLNGLILAGFITACGGSQAMVTLSVESSVEITPYRTATITSDLDSSQEISEQTPDSSLEPLPSPTPLIYTIVEGDTMLDVALRYNLSLDLLIAANPNLDPRAMSIGTELIIPLGQEEGEVGIPTSTPVPVDYDTPVCYPTNAGDLWCFLSISNSQSATLENLGAVIRLYAGNGEEVASEDGSALLNILPPGSSLPIVANFQPPVPNWESSKGEVYSALVVIDEDERYLPVELKDLQVNTDANGSQATIQGQLWLPESLTSANLIWVLAVAYSENGNVNGVRRLEINEELSPEEDMPIEFQVFSLGTWIDKVEVFVEARP